MNEKLSFDDVNKLIGLPNKKLVTELEIPDEEPTKSGLSIAELVQTGPGFCAKQRRAPDWVLIPFLKQGGRLVVGAQRGVGKTWFSLALARAIAVGRPFFDEDETEDPTTWTAPKPRHVLYLDGEMEPSELAWRMRQMGLDRCPNFHIFAVCEEGIPDEARELDLANPESREAVLEAIETVGADVVILDNVSCLYRPLADGNSVESFRDMNDFITRRLPSLEQRPAIVLVDHLGKAIWAGARGTSAKTDHVDAVIELTSQNSLDEAGTCILARFTKSRGFYGDAAKPVEFQVQDGRFTRLVVQALEDEEKPKKKRETKRPEVEALLKAGVQVAVVAEKAGVSTRYVYDIRKDIQDEIPTQQDTPNWAMDL